MSDVKKIAISLPGKLMRRLERARKRSGETRSAFIKHALEQALAQREKAAIIARWEDGYRRRPETAEEVTAAEASASQLLAGEPWE
ncbi:MAG TPA: ribbon-helix-helix protein, CopG family [bacterium]|nr:ribbon-helix-helix protein, CopG family [bacterium]